MEKFTASCSYGPEVTTKDPLLSELLRGGVRELIAKCVEIEIEIPLGEYEALHLEDGIPAFVRNKYFSGQTVQTGIGDVEERGPSPVAEVVVA